MNEPGSIHNLPPRAQANIVLTGFMGTGKTTTGRALARRLGRKFVDTDALIMARTGRSIPAIFAEDGEAAFRAWEGRIARELAEQHGLVIATGGGLMLNPDNAAVLGDGAFVFCLTATPEAILARLQHDRQRPLLQGTDPAGRIGELMAQRDVAYSRFVQIDTTGRRVRQIVDDIIRQLDVDL